MPEAVVAQPSRFHFNIELGQGLWWGGSGERKGHTFVIGIIVERNFRHFGIPWRSWAAYGSVAAKKPRTHPGALAFAINSNP